MPASRIARFNSLSKAEGMHLTWSAAERVLMVEELGKSISPEAVRQLLGVSNLDVLDEAALADALGDVQVGDDAPAAAAPPAGKDGKRALVLAIVALVFLAAGFAGGFLGRGYLDDASPELPPVARVTEPTATPEPVPASYDASRAAETVRGYYGALASGDHAAALALAVGGLGGKDAAKNAKAAGLSASVETTADLAASLTGLTPSSESTAAAYYDLGVLEGVVKPVTLAGDFPAPQAWLVWDKEADTYLVLDRLVPWTARKPRSDEYVSKAGLTTVRVRVSTVYVSPWAAYASMDYKDNGSAGGVPIVLTPSKEDGGLRASWTSKGEKWTDPHAMKGGTYLLAAEPVPGATEPLRTSGKRIPLMATRQDRNIMPAITLP